MGGGGERGPGQYLGGTWGDLGSPKQKGITTYALSPNRQRPLAGALHAAVYNTWRRASGQFFYVVPPFIGLYLVFSWANNRNEYLNSKEGRAKYGGVE